MTNHQRVGAISNAHAGREFEAEALAYFAQREGLHLSPSFPVQLGVSDARKLHRFDLGSEEHREATTVGISASCQRAGRTGLLHLMGGHMAGTRPRTTVELEHALEDALNQLERSCDAFDDGHEDEAKRIALAIRILVRDTRNQTSILTRLNRLDATSFLSLCGPSRPPGSSEPFAGLALIEMDSDNGAQRYIAPLDSGLSEEVCQPFSQWWSASVLNDGHGVDLTRSSTVLMVADKDGGAHVDDLPEEFAQIAHDDSLGWNPAGLPDGVDKSVVYVTVRQIGHEVLKTLRPGYSKKRPANFDRIVLYGPPRRLQLSITESNPPRPDTEGTSEAVRLRPQKPMVPTRMIPRLSACGCGSGRRYKDCCGKLN